MLAFPVSNGMIATTPEELKALRAAGKILSGVLIDVAALCKEGANTAELDLAAEHAIVSRGAVPAFLNYQPEGAAYPYPATLCVSINDEVVHGIPNEKRILRDGDILSIDAGLNYQGYFVDAARTLCIGKGDEQAHKLITATKEALASAIGVARVGNHVGDIGAVVAGIAAKYRLGIVRDLGGHGVGKAVHEKPFIANDGKRGEGEEIIAGMVLAIEPMLAEGKGDIVLDEDEWTYRMEDGKRAAHFEETVLITETGAEILTA
mgnify:CR=1 FL=1